MADASTHKGRMDRKQDEAVQDSFPASDPPANSGVVGPGGVGTHPATDPRRADPNRREEAAQPKGSPTSDRHAAETAYHREDQAGRSDRD
jgi:hypothetical protein